MKQLRFKAKAVKQLNALPKHDRKAILTKMHRYSQGDLVGLDIKRLQGLGDFRLRHGNWRAVFTDEGLVVEVIRVAHRREVY